MKIYFFIFVLLINFQSWSKADDISEFQIERMSIGDSLLDYFSKNTIENNAQEDQFPNDKYIIRSFWKLENFKKYELVNVMHLKNDKKYIIEGITGLVSYNNAINQCLEQKDIIESQFDAEFKNAKKNSGQLKKSFDKTGNSKGYVTEYTLKDGSIIQIACDDWSEEMSNNGYSDSLTISMQTYELGNFILNDAYK